MISEILRDETGKPIFVDALGRPCSELGFVLPSDKAANNIETGDKRSYYETRQLFQICQQEGIDVSIIDHLGAKEASLPISVYQDIDKTKNRFTKWLSKHHSDSLIPLWDEVHTPKYSNQRRLLTRGQEIDWFCDRFLAGHGLDLSKEDSFLPLYMQFGTFIPYGLMAAIICSEDFGSLHCEKIECARSTFNVFSKGCLKDAEKFKNSAVEQINEFLNLLK